jgi:hypothetical protein
MAVKFPKNGLWVEFSQFDRHGFSLEVHSLDELLKEVKNFFENDYTEDGGSLSMEMTEIEDDEDDLDDEDEEDEEED